MLQWIVSIYAHSSSKYEMIFVHILHRFFFEHCALHNGINCWIELYQVNNSIGTTKKHIMVTNKNNYVHCTPYTIISHIKDERLHENLLSTLKFHHAKCLSKCSNCTTAWTFRHEQNTNKKNMKLSTLQANRNSRRP